MADKLINFWVPEELRMRLKVMAAQNDSNISREMRRILIEALDVADEEARKIPNQPRYPQA